MTFGTVTVLMASISCGLPFRWRARMRLPPFAALPALALPGWRRCLAPLLSCVLMGLAGCGGGGDGEGSAAGEGSGGSAGGGGGSGALVVDASPLRAAVQLDTARAATQTLPID